MDRLRGDVRLGGRSRDRRGSGAQAARRLSGTPLSKEPAAPPPPARSRTKAPQALLSARPTLVDGVLAAVVLVLSLGHVVVHHVGVAGFVLSIGLAAPLVWRRRWPLPIFGFIVVVAFAQWVVGLRLVADVALLLSLYTVASTESRRRSLAAAGLLLVGVVLASVRFAPAGGGVIGSIVFLSGLVLAAYFLGVSVRTRRVYLASLVDRAERLELERDQQLRLAATAERTRIAREMHDIVAHSLSVMITLADGAALSNDRRPLESTDAMRQVSTTGRQALAEMRRLLGVLRDDAAGAADAALAPQPGLGRLDDLLEQVRATGLVARLTVTGTPVPLSGTADATAYRVVQEGLTNSLKHAREATEVRVSLLWERYALVIEVSDDGRLVRTAHASGAAPSGAGHGLAGMRERLSLFGGAATAGPARTRGWRVRATLPLDEAARG